MNVSHAARLHPVRGQLLPPVDYWIIFAANRFAQSGPGDGRLRHPLHRIGDAPGSTTSIGIDLTASLASSVRCPSFYTSQMLAKSGCLSVRPGACVLFSACPRVLGREAKRRYPLDSISAYSIFRSSGVHGLLGLSIWLAIWCGGGGGGLQCPGGL